MRIETLDDGCTTSRRCGVNYVRRVAFDDPGVTELPGGYKGQVLYAGEGCFVIATLVPAGVEGPPRHTHRGDQIYVVLEGSLTVELGGEERTVSVGECLFIGSGVPHHNRNDGSVDEVHLEVIAPGAAVMGRLAEPTDTTETGGARFDVFSERPQPRTGPFTVGWLVDRSTGSEHASIYVGRMEPGASGPPWHVHEFDQFYFVLDGTLSVDVALQHHEVGPGSLIVLPAGVPHQQRNASAEAPERHLAILVPEPATSDHWDAAVEFSAGHSG
jgi:mannose-6-phosphate isomerase-like protein (cupin superfamily)